MRKFRTFATISFTAGSLLLAATAFAADGEIRGDIRELRQDHRELVSDHQDTRQDRKELNQDVQELRSDRKELRDDLKNGVSKSEIAQDVKEIRQDRKGQTANSRALLRNGQTFAFVPFARV